MYLGANDFEYQKGYGFEYKQFRLVKRRTHKPEIKALGFESFGTGDDEYCDTQSQTHSWLIVGAIVRIPPYFPSSNLMWDTNKLGYFIRIYKSAKVVQIGEVYRIGNQINFPNFDEYSSVSSIIPRCHHTDNEIITCMRIFQSSDRLEDMERHWTRFPGSEWKTIENQSLGLGFQELNNKQCEKNLREISDEIKDKNNTRSYVGIYVPKNTSLYMIDTIRSLNIYDTDHERTLFQEGSVIILENMELRFNRFHYLHKNIQILNFDELGLNHKMRTNPFFILRPVLEYVRPTSIQRCLTLWGLMITHEIRNGKKLAVLQIPQSAEFERVYEWEDGVTNVIKKMKAKPWDKYVCIQGKDNTNFPIQAFNGPYPGFKENSIEDRDWSEESVSESVSDHESHDSESRIVLTDEEREYITRLNSYKESRTETNTRTAYQTFKDWTETSPKK